MCLIIDANCALETLCASPSKNFAPVQEALLKRNAKMVIGGKKLRDAYERLPPVWRSIRMLDRAGRVRMVKDVDVDTLEAILDVSGALASNDPHIIALAKIAGVRLLCSRDQNLHRDFVSATLINKPRGKVYQNASHAALIRDCCRSLGN